MSLSKHPRPSILLAVGLAVAVLGFAGACNKGAKTESVSASTPAPTLDIAAVEAVLGQARDDASGVIDFTQGDNEAMVSYRYYDEDLQNVDNDLVNELTPKIEQLYAKYPHLDRVLFQVSINSTTPGEFRPYLNFVMTKKILKETEWSGILAEDFLKNVIEVKRFD